MFVNIHTHISSNSGYTEIVNLTLKEAREVFNSNRTGLFSVGIHPWEVDNSVVAVFPELEKWLLDKRFVMLGECGLDKFAHAPFELQKSVFEQQVLLSEKTKKPLIIHCVGYYNELFEIKQQLKPQQLWIIHGFRGKPQLAQQAIKNGCTLSFGEHFNAESVKITPVNSLYVETDESKLKVDEIYTQIAFHKSCTVEDLNAGKKLIHFIINHNSL